MPRVSERARLAGWAAIDHRYCVSFALQRKGACRANDASAEDRGAPPVLSVCGSQCIFLVTEVAEGVA